MRIHGVFTKEMNEMIRSPLQADNMTKHKMCYSDLHHYLFNKNAVRAIKIDQLRQKVIEFTNDKRRERRSRSPGEVILNTADIKRNLLDGIRNDNPRLSRALESFPSEVQLCTSSIPCVVYGVCARKHIPIGTWIGPYEGKHNQPNSSVNLIAKDNFYMWEVFSGNQLAYYLDGSNENTSSWMRFIACARNTSEQNLYAFQYCGNIYYRAFKEITPGTELLVWYDDIYPQFMGIPLKIKDLGNMETEAINASLPSNMNSPIKSPDDAVGNSFFIHTSQSTVQSSITINDVTMSRVSSANSQDNKSDDREIYGEKDSVIGLFRCGQCDKVFPQRSVLQLHICTRTPSKPFECGFCGNGFANPSDLRAHSAIHCNEKPFKCGYCSRAFSGATTLNNHIRRHTGDMPFKCHKCDKTFSHGAQLSRHQSIECKQVSGNGLQTS